MIEHDGAKWDGAIRDDRPKAGEIPIFEMDPEDRINYPNGESLPAITVYERLFDEEERCVGRTFTMRYPSYPDEGGDDALYYGGGYYEEGMSYTDPADHDKRVQCFQAAELLYRHAAARGNAVADMCLGYVYSYDRCEGRYWRGPHAGHGEGGGLSRPYPRKERAFECLKAAAEAGIPEACYKLGDMYKHGTGCTPDAAKAFDSYARASKLAQREQPHILGSIALRLGGCYEEGFGCAQDFERAATWYEKSVAGLEFAVGHGQSWYEKALAGARAGMKRCRQELAE